ncbi:MAG: tRNA (guanosine(46)-N7)-methyltransferase TrmB [Opitutales bacterium]
MEISESYALELAKQAARKADLRAALAADLDGVESVLFEPGCGHGHWLNGYAEAHPDLVCVGVDLISWRIRKAEAKRDKRGLKNLYFYKADLREFLEVLPPRIRFEQTVMLFPDPWPKARHHRRRMVQTAFLDELARRTKPGGTFCFRSDDRPYYDWTLEHLEAHPDWELDPHAPWPHEQETYFQELMESYHSTIARRV